MTAPVLLTSGDPSGVGPELAVKARAALGDTVPFVWLGDPRHLPEGTLWEEVSMPAAVRDIPTDRLPVLVHRFAAEAAPGAPDPANARCVCEVIERAVSLAMEGAVSAICTAPISKEELITHAGFDFPGHTEFLAALSGDIPVAMMLASATLNVVPVTIHVPLAQVPTTLTPDRLETTIRITRAAMIRDFGIAAPRLAVAGLNPHAGEGGLMGREEAEVIGPVLDRLRSEGFDIAGPLSADTMFHPPARARYDAAIAMYHDQALIPIKTLAFDEGVNVTLGLPFVRTSPDHGTAFDIAGKGIGRATSTVEALKLAALMAARRAQ